MNIRNWFKPKFKISQDVREYIRSVCKFRTDLVEVPVTDEPRIFVQPKFFGIRVIAEGSDRDSIPLKILFDNIEYSEEEVPEKVLIYIEDNIRNKINKNKINTEKERTERISKIRDFSNSLI